VPNSEINRVANESQVRSRVAVAIGVSSSEDLQRAMSVLADAADDPGWKGRVKSAAEVQGFYELGEDAVDIRVIVWVAAGERRRFERILRFKLKKPLDQAEVEMPNRQVDVWLRGQPRPASWVAHEAA